MVILLEKGYVHLYFGEGLSQLPIAAGIALRARGAGLLTGHFKNFNSELPKITKDFEMYDMIILDGCDGICENTLTNFIANRPKNTELVLTAKSFSNNIIEMADLVSTILEVRG